MGNITQLFPSTNIPPDEADALLIELLEAAREWKQGRLPLSEIIRLTTPKERYAARRRLPPVAGDPDHELFKEMTEAICREQFTREHGSLVFTRHGIFTQRELEAGSFTWRDGN